jgi:FixJ family two-component response regulator
MNLPATSRPCSLPPVVFVIDSSDSVRAALEQSLRDAGWQARSFASAVEFLAQPRVLAASCLVVAFSLPGLGGLGLQRLLAERSELPIVFMAQDGDIAMTVQAMKAGAVGVLTQPFDPEELTVVVEDALDRSRHMLVEATQVGSLRKRQASLTSREREVMTLVVRGLLNKQIGAELGISEITVKAHRGRLMRKMESDSVAELVSMAMRLEPAVSSQLLGQGGRFQGDRAARPVYPQQTRVSIGEYASA